MKSPVKSSASGERRIHYKLRKTIINSMNLENVEYFLTILTSFELDIGVESYNQSRRHGKLWWT